MSKFEIGDEVVCIKPHPLLEVGKKYVVKNVNKTSLFIGIDNTGGFDIFFKSFFQKVIPSSSKTYHLIDKNKLSFVMFEGKECLIIPEELTDKLIYKGDLLWPTVKTALLHLLLPYCLAI